MKILHVEAGKHLYGGARQVLYIVEGLAARASPTCWPARRAARWPASSRPAPGWWR